MLYYTTLTVICLSFLFSLVSIRRGWPRHLRLIALLLGFEVLNETLISRLIPRIWPHSTNIAWYNIVMGIEFAVFAYYYYLVLQNKRIKTLIGYYLAILPVFWFVVTLKVFGINDWNSYLSITGGIITVCLSVALYYQLFTEPQLVRLSTSSEFWIATALIIYYCGTLPFTGMMNFLSTNLPVFADHFITILQTLNIVLYSLISYAFLCRINTRKSMSY